MRTMLDFLNDFSKVLGHGHALRHVPQSWRSIWQLNGGWQLAGQSRNLVYGWNNEAWYKFGLAGWEPSLVPIDPETGRAFDAIPDRALVHRSKTGRVEIAAWEDWEGTTLHQNALITAYAGPAPGRALLSMRVAAVAWQDAAAYAKIHEFRLRDWRPEDEARPDRLYQLWQAAQLSDLDVDPVLVAVAMYRDGKVAVDSYGAEHASGSVPAFLVARNLPGDLRVVAGLRGTYADRWMVLYGDRVIRRGLHSREKVWDLFPGIEARVVSYYDLDENERCILDDEWAMGCGHVFPAGRVGYPREKALREWKLRQAERDRYGEVMPK